jgi:hypothetical protein
LEKKLRQCVVCRNQYTFCPRCNDDKNKPLWYFTFDSENCKNIYDVTSKYEDGRLSANEAKDILEKLNLAKITNFGESYKASIAKINEATTIKVVGVVEDIIEESIIEDIIEESVTDTDIIIEEKVVKKPRKAKRNVNVE